jgi:hypothetical protein
MRLFLPQTQLEEWALEDKADVKDGVLVVTGEEGVYPVTPAVHIVQLVTGEDANELGETAYEVVPGYVAEVPVPSSEGAPADGKPGSEADLLAAFLLNKMG